MAEQGATERVSVNDLNVAEKVSISGAEAPEAKPKEKKEKPKKAPKEKKPVVHGGGAQGGQPAALLLSSLSPNYLAVSERF